jgi:hypothetical protein
MSFDKEIDRLNVMHEIGNKRMSNGKTRISKDVKRVTMLEDIYNTVTKLDKIQSLLYLVAVVNWTSKPTKELKEEKRGNTSSILAALPPPSLAKVKLINTLTATAAEVETKKLVVDQKNKKGCFGWLCRMFNGYSTAKKQLDVVNKQADVLKDQTLTLIAKNIR